MGAENNLGQHGCDGEHFHVGQQFVGLEGYGVGGDNFLQTKTLQPLVGLIFEEGVGEDEVNVFRAALPNGFDGFDDGATGEDFIIDEEDVFAFNVTNDGEGFGLTGVEEATLFDNGEGRAEFFRPVTTFFGKAEIG